MSIMSLYSSIASAFLIDKAHIKMMNLRPITLIPKSYSIGRRKSSYYGMSTSLNMSSDKIGPGDENAEGDERREQKNEEEDFMKNCQNYEMPDASDHKPSKIGKDDTLFNGKIEKEPKVDDGKNIGAEKKELLRRIIQLEGLAGSQAVEIRKLREECKRIKEAAEAFGQVVELLRQAGLSVDQSAAQSEEIPRTDTMSNSNSRNSRTDEPSSKKKSQEPSKESHTNDLVKEFVDEAEIFGSAPASVSDAADAAGASILAALLGGKQRMLVDVRDAELSRVPDVLVQFIELAILPVAAGLEGLKTQKNRVKIVFPTVSQLMQYRKTMALAAPEVVSLSTLGFDPVEKRDNLVVIVAPSPDDEEGLLQMNELITSDSIRQPVVVLNHHMVPLSGPAGTYDPIYHLRLLTVQYMAGEATRGNVEQKDEVKSLNSELLDDTDVTSQPIDMIPKTNYTSEGISNNNTTEKDVEDLKLSSEKEDAALAAAMEHAHELGIHQGVTRAMVIRAYPRPWHVFVDTSPDTDADFEVAATFDEYPSQDDINYAIVECLEGSEREDELVAQQMQEAIESGQLDSISDMLGLTDIDKRVGSDEENEADDDEFYNDWDPWFGADTV